MNDESTLLSQALGLLLHSRRWVITTAESCAGGGIAQAITEIPGSSAWFEQGFVTYSNQSKISLLGVTPQLLGGDGAVSQPVVEAMAEGATKLALANCAIAVSGIAGPTGGSDEKPVGTVWIAWKVQGVPVISQSFLLSGGRESVRSQSVIVALKEMNRLLEKNTV